YFQLFSRCYYYFPSTLNDSDWKILLKCRIRKQRLDYLKFRCKNECENLKEFAKDEQREESLRCLRSMIIDPYPTLAIDCRFLSFLSPRALSLTLLQIRYLIANNNSRQFPWPIYLCNVNFNDENLVEAFSKLINVEITFLNYTKIFSPSRIIYLSPHANEELKKISGNEVFILGGIVDRVQEHGIHPQASLVAAKEDNVVVQKLPLNKYIDLKAGLPYLTLTSVSSILYDAYSSRGDWHSSIQR
ncbi:unnamed protein product, partial [Dracunculus medinensis]|uniref:SAM-dependent MTase TRM10-type domain-containing protein n=1 Tax=Dracunculus medinensis TaxID=318479 RepID=A0A0N4UCD2_DRAME